MVICSCGMPSPFFGIPTAATVPHSIGRWKRWKHDAISYGIHSVQRHRTNLDVVMVIPTYPKHTYHIDPLCEGRKRKSIIQHYKLWQSAGVVDLSQNHSAMQLPRSIQMKFARAQPIATLFQGAWWSWWCMIDSRLQTKRIKKNNIANFPTQSKSSSKSWSLIIWSSPLSELSTDV